jgi:hypothetical protein
MMMEVKKIEIEKGYGKCGIGKLVFHLGNGEKRILEVDELLRYCDENHQQIAEVQYYLQKLMERRSVWERFQQLFGRRN